MKIIERWKKSLYRKAVKHRLIAPQVIVLMDGGVCSQMHQYLLGRIFENGGHKVLYDLSFYGSPYRISTWFFGTIAYECKVLTATRE